MIVGINPAPTSVAAGHYYQGRMGRWAMSRLVDVGVLPAPTSGQHVDDAAFAAGIGFTDLVRRPTTSSESVSAQELSDGEKTLRQEIRARRPGMIIAVFGPTGESSPRRRLRRVGSPKRPVRERARGQTSDAYTPRQIATQAWEDVGQLWREMVVPSTMGTP